MVGTMFHRCTKSFCRRGAGDRLFSKSGFPASCFSGRTSVSRASSDGLALAAVASAVSVLAGLLVGSLGLSGFAAIFGLIAAYIFLARPLYGLVGTFFVLNLLMVIDREQRIGFTLPGVGGTISATDLCYALMIACAIWKVTMGRDSYFPENKLTTPLAILFVWSVVELAVGIAAGNQVKKTLIEWRPFLYLTIFYLTVYLVRDRETFVWVMKGFFLAYVATFGLGMSIFVQGRKTIEYFTVGQMDPGQSALPRFTFVPSDLVLCLLFICLGLIIFLKDRKRVPVLTLMAALLLLNLFLIQARTQIVALFLGLIPILVLAPGPKRLQFIAAGAAGLVFVALLLFSLAQTESGRKKIVDPIAERFSGIYKKKTEVDQSLERREIEFKVMQHKLVNRPLIGHGFGSKWTTDPIWTTIYDYDVTYIHSSWLFFLFKTGAIGAFLVMHLFYKTVRIALDIVRDERIPMFRGIALGIVAAMPTFAFSGILQPTLWHFQTAPIIGFEFAATVIMAHLLSQEKRSVAPDAGTISNE